MSIKDAMRERLLASYRFRSCSETYCVLCERSITRAAFEMLWYYAAPNSKLPTHAQAESIAGGQTWRVVFPICEKCAPPCRKCSLPRRTKAVGALADRLTAMRGGKEVTGQGHCRHAHFLGMVF